jgi:hypothetical protein
MTSSGQSNDVSSTAYGMLKRIVRAGCARSGRFGAHRRVPVPVESLHRSGSRCWAVSRHCDHQRVSLGKSGCHHHDPLGTLSGRNQPGSETGALSLEPELLSFPTHWRASLRPRVPLQYVTRWRGWSTPGRACSDVLRLPLRSTAPRREALSAARPRVVDRADVGRSALALTVCQQAAVRQRPYMARTGFPRRSPQADFSRQGHGAESQVPGAASYSRWRPQAATFEGLLVVDDSGHWAPMSLLGPINFQRGASAGALPPGSRFP